MNNRITKRKRQKHTDEVEDTVPFGLCAGTGSLPLVIYGIRSKTH